VATGLEQVVADGRWEAAHVGLCVVGADGEILAAAGDLEHRFRLASISKPLLA
jgi:hypothetical protein